MLDANHYLLRDSTDQVNTGTKEINFTSMQRQAIDTNGLN